MGNGRTSFLCAAAVAVAMVPDALRAQSAIPEGAVKRPDGSVVYPPTPSDSGSRTDWWQRESDARAAERERHRLDAEAARQERAEQSQREREAAATNPARQIPPSQKNF